MAGRSEPNVRLEINDEVIGVDAEGNFSQAFDLVPNENTFLLVATDRAGNSVRLTSVIVYEAPGD